MIYVLPTLWPLFFLIIAGHFMQKWGFPGREFWPGAERFNYFVLFPALLVTSLATAPLRDPALPRLLLAMSLTVAVCCLGLGLAWRWAVWPAARFGVVVQGTLRFNTYLGLAVVGGLFGRPGLALSAVVLALLVPIVNVLSVLALTADGKPSLRSILLPLVKNPLILSCIVGAAINLAGIQLTWGVDRLLALLAGTSLPLGLLSVGAALKPSELHGEIRALFASSVVRLMGVPLVALGCALALDLSVLERSVLVLFFALPTAPTSYVLTRQLGGDGHLMAGIITLQTLLSAATLALILAFL